MATKRNQTAVAIRMYPQDLRVFKRAAKRSRKTFSLWVREILTAAAEEQLRQRT